MYDPIVDNKHIYNFEMQFLDYFNFFTKITVLLFLVGFFQENPIIFVDFNFIMKVCLALFLIYRFNNYRKHEIKFTELDRKVCYSSGIYILIISFIDYINSYADTIKKLIVPYTSEVITKFQ